MNSNSQKNSDSMTQPPKWTSIFFKKLAAYNSAAVVTH